MIDQSDLRIAPINRKPAFIERLAGARPGTYATYCKMLDGIGVADRRFFSDIELEEIRERCNRMRADPDLRKLHDFASTWFGVPTRAARSLLWTWGHVERPLRIVAGEEIDPERCSELLYTQGVDLPATVSIFETGGLQWTARGSLTIGD